MNKTFLLVLKILFAIGGVAYIAYAIQWQDTESSPGIFTILKQADHTLMWISLLILAPVYPIQMLRWWLLMRCRGLQVSMGRAFRLMMVGCFFNYCMPGTTGGDVVKAFYAARRSDRRTDAVMSVIFDRITGLLGLILIAGVFGLFMLHDPIARKVTIFTWIGAGIVVVISAFYFSRHLREGSGLGRLLGRFSREGLIGKIDDAAVAYGKHKTTVFVAVLMSVPVHLLIAMSTALSGYALGAEQPMGLMLTVIPILWLAGSMPLTYQGLGVMEGLGRVLLLHGVANPAMGMNYVVGMIMLVRIYQVVYSLLGALFLLRGDIHLHPQNTPETLPQDPTGE